MSGSADLNENPSTMLPMEGKFDEDGNPYPRMYGGGRTKQTARKCTGGPPPRRQPLFWESMARSANTRKPDEPAAGSGDQSNPKRAKLNEKGNGNGKVDSDEEDDVDEEEEDDEDSNSDNDTTTAVAAAPKVTKDAKAKLPKKKDLEDSDEEVEEEGDDEDLGDEEEVDDEDLGSDGSETVSPVAANTVAGEAE